MYQFVALIQNDETHSLQAYSFRHGDFPNILTYKNDIYQYTGHGGVLHWDLWFTASRQLAGFRFSSWDLDKSLMESSFLLNSKNVTRNADGDFDVFFVQPQTKLSFDQCQNLGSKLYANNNKFILLLSEDEGVQALEVCKDLFAR